jgi:hypothetical protein
VFVTGRFPYPPWRGDQARAYHQLRLLGSRHRISLVCLVDQAPSPEQREAVAGLCAELRTVTADPAQRVSAAASGFFSGLPLQVAAFGLPALRRAVRETLARERPDLLHVQLARLAPVAEGVLEVPRAIDLVDALSLNMRRRRQRDRGPLALLAGMEERRLLQYERDLCLSFDRRPSSRPTSVR